MTYRQAAGRGHAEAAAPQNAMPEVMRAFHGVMRAASAGEAIDPRIKEFIALAIAIATR